jgi:hypothetical protein
MVTKGYRKGVYDRVTEETWKAHRNGNWRKTPVQGHNACFEDINNRCKRRPRENDQAHVVGDSGARQRRKQKYQNSEKGRPGEAAKHVPDHDAHRLDPPRGGDRE